jgi:hypothetical protein
MIAKFSNYSFVQFEQPSVAGCCPDPAFCLPMSDPSHCQFYLYLSGIDVSIYAGSSYPLSRIVCFAYVVPTTMATPPSGYTAYNPYNGTGPTPLIFGNHFTPLYPATTADMMMVHFDYTWGSLSSQVDMGECFKLMLMYVPINTDSGTRAVGDTVFIGFTNSFQRIDTSACFTSVLTYSNNSNAFDFQYLWGKPNVVELPMYLRDPKMENDQKVYTKSDGTLVKLYERKEEVYTLETDLMPYAWHKALDIALSQDNVAIQNNNASNFDPIGTSLISAVATNVNGGTTTIAIDDETGYEIDTIPSIVTYPATGGTTTTVTTISANNAINFIKKESYEIEYQKAPLSALGKGTCKLSNAQPVNLINNNCG